ncbi:uncharacterized protein B0T23DRAFT_7248 [Neurospora hispaniola]|uniref:Secreted protein n=1 Tax=Neurospora hispaniola TaxID=588809 RepID=A0AAJ0IES7_9PEZI|nr:hypothetical protein B0T23DRAFT_7248 [Neurospora hispaniola]
MMTFMTFSSLALLFMLSFQSQFFCQLNIRTSNKGAAGQSLRKDTTHTKIRDGTATGARERIGKQEPPRGARNDKKDWRWNFLPQ